MEENTNLIKIGEAARMLGVTTWTLRRWDVEGILSPTFRSRKRSGGTRYYSRQVINRITKNYSD
jgi:DNA-binding transcriptional MerR regulator